MAQAVSCQPFTTEAWFCIWVSPCGICGGHSGTGTGFSPSSSVLFCQDHSTMALHIHMSFGGWTLGPLGVAVQRQFHPHRHEQYEEGCCEGVNCIHLDQDMNEWQVLWTWYWTFRFHKRLGIYWLAEPLSAFQEGLSSIELAKAVDSVQCAFSL
jgi:hypothetical protein